MRRQPSLTINGIALPLRVGGEIVQVYEDFGGFSLLRLGLGAAVHQEAWRRVRTTLSATGIVPPGLAAIDWTAAIALGCVGPRSIQSATNVIALPGVRRTDAPPYGFAIDAVGRLLPTAVNMAADTATLTALSGAIGYQVLWYPVLTVHAPSGVRVRFDAAGSVAGWELTAEEV